MEKPLLKSLMVPLIFLAVTPGWGSSLRFSARLSAGTGFSSNVFESLDDPVVDLFGRLGLRAGLKTPRTGLGSLSLASSTGLEGYAQYGEENRILQQSVFRYSGHQLLGFLTPGFLIKSRIQRFFTIERGYDILYFQPVLGIRFSPALLLEAFAQNNRFDWVTGSNYDSESTGLGLRLRWQSPNGVTVDLNWNRSSTRFDRFAYAPAPAPSFWQPLSETQTDRTTTLSCWLEFYFDALFRIGLTYRSNASNSYGYAYTCPELTFLISRQLFSRFTFTAYFNVQQKQYHDDLSPVFLIHPDTEREDNNYLMLVIDRDLTDTTSLQFKGGATRNESPFRSRYYQKSFFSIGLNTRF